MRSKREHWTLAAMLGLMPMVLTNKGQHVPDPLLQLDETFQAQLGPPQEDKTMPVQGRASSQVRHLAAAFCAICSL